PLVGEVAEEITGLGWEVAGRGSRVAGRGPRGHSKAIQAWKSASAISASRTFLSAFPIFPPPSDLPTFRPSVLPSFRPSVLPSFRPPHLDQPEIRIHRLEVLRVGFAEVTVEGAEHGGGRGDGGVLALERARQVDAGEEAGAE